MPLLLRAGLVALGVTLALPPSAAAHDGVLFGVRPFVEDHELIGGGTSYGLVLAEDDTYLWTCKEAMGGTPFWWHRADAGRLVVGTNQGIRTSEDGGCTWSTPTGVAGELSSFSVAVRPTDPSHLLSTTGTTGVPNHLLESLDGGGTWTSLIEFSEAAVWRAVWDLGGQSIVVEVVDSSGVARFFRSEDAGQTWPSEGVEIEGWQSVGLFGPSSDGASLWLSGLSPQGEFSLARLPIALDGAIEPLLTFPQTVTSFVEQEDGLHIVVGSMTYLIWSGLADDDPVEQDPGVSACLYGIDDALWGCGGEPMHAQFSRRLPGGDWEEIIRLEDIEPRSCPEDSAAATLCPEVWDEIQESLQPPASGDDDDSAAQEEDGCAQCSDAGGEESLALLILAAPLGLRRRRGRRVLRAG